MDHQGHHLADEGDGSVLHGVSVADVCPDHVLERLLLSLKKNPVLLAGFLKAQLLCLKSRLASKVLGWECLTSIPPPKAKGET